MEVGFGYLLHLWDKLSQTLLLLYASCFLSNAPLRSFLFSPKRLIQPLWYITLSILKRFHLLKMNDKDVSLLYKAPSFLIKNHHCGFLDKRTGKTLGREAEKRGPHLAVTLRLLSISGPLKRWKRTKTLLSICESPPMPFPVCHNRMIGVLKPTKGNKSICQ